MTTNIFNTPSKIILFEQSVYYRGIRPLYENSSPDLQYTVLWILWTVVNFHALLLISKALHKICTPTSPTNGLLIVTNGNVYYL